MRRDKLFTANTNYSNLTMEPWEQQHHTWCGPSVTVTHLKNDSVHQNVFVRQCAGIAPINLPSTYVVSQRAKSSHRDAQTGRPRRNGGVVGRERRWHNFRDIHWRVHEDLHTSFRSRLAGRQLLE
jgi:hypothetical protein